MKNITSYLAGGLAVIALAACNSSSTSPRITPTTPPTNATYQQIGTYGRPAIKELFEQFSDHETSNRVAPYNDTTLQAAIGSFSTTVAGRSSAIVGVLQAVLYPDEMTIDVSQSGTAAYLGNETGGATTAFIPGSSNGKFGGRGLGDDVITISTESVFGPVIPQVLKLAPEDNAENVCLETQNLTQDPGQVGSGTFPFLHTPH